MVGRSRALSDLAGAVTDVVGGTCHLVELIGEPGAGKTRLLREAAAMAGRHDLVVLNGRASEFETDSPLAAVIDALDAELEDAWDRIRDDLGEHDRAALGGLFPWLEETAVGDGTARYGLYRAIRSVLELLAAPTGLALLIDDAHWADEATCELLTYLVRRPMRRRVLIVVSYRPAQVSPLLRSALAREGEGFRTEIEVGPLTQAEVDELLGSEVSRVSRRLFYTCSGGNPFYLDALVRQGERWLAAEAGVDASEIPDSVRAVLQAELSRLSPGARLAMRAAAVAGDEFDPELIAVAGELDELDVLGALDELVRRDVLRTAAARGRFTFRHPLVRSAAYNSAEGGWLWAAHGRVAAHFVDRGAMPARYAHHLARSITYGDVDSAKALFAAARTESGRAPATAAQWLIAALPVLPDQPEIAPLRLAMLGELARAQHSSGQIIAGRDTANELLAALPPTAHAERAMAARACAIMERMLGRPDQARRLIHTELVKVPDRGMIEVAPLLMRLAAEDIWDGNVEAARRTLDELTEAHGESDVPVALAVTSLRAMAEYVNGDVIAALSSVDRADALMAVAGPDEIAPWLDMITWLCWAEQLSGRHASALERLDRALEIAARTGNAFIVAWLRGGRANALGMLGRFAEAITVAEEATEIGRLLGDTPSQAMSTGLQSILHGWVGNREEALKLGERAVELAGGSREWWASQAEVALGLAMLDNGDTQGAREVITKACAQLEAGALDRSLLLTCAEAMAATEAPPEAAKWAARGEAVAHPDIAEHPAMISLITAHAIAEDDPAESARLARAAAERLEELGLTPAAAKARARAGTSLAAIGDKAGARGELTTAMEMFTSCGARLAVERTVRELRRTGAHVPTQRARENGQPFGLSARELQVGTLVVSGSTNKRIAEQLFLSIRTVETHLTHIKGKLGVRSRAEIARLLGPLVDPG